MNRHTVSRRTAPSSPGADAVGWLGVGVLTLGMGAAVLAGGSGVAYADEANDSAGPSSSADDGDGAGPRARASSARTSAAHAAGHVKPHAGELSGTRAPAAARVAGGAKRAVDPFGVTASSSTVTVRVPTAGTGRPPAPDTIAATSSATAAAVRQSPVQQLVGAVVNVLVALGGMDPVAPEPGKGNLWQQGLYSVARWLADTANPGGIPTLVTSSVGGLDPATATASGRALFTTAAGDAVTYRVSTDPTEGSATVNPDGSFTYTPLQSTLLGAPEDGATVTMVMNAYHGVQKSSQIFKITLPKPGPLFNFTIGVGDWPIGIGLSPNGQRLVVANSQADTISVIDTATNSKVGLDIAVGDGPYSVTFAPDSSAAYVVNNQSHTVSRVSLVTNAVQTIALPDDSFGFSAMGPAGTPAANRLYLTNGVTNGVTVVDTTTNSVVGGTISVGQFPEGLAVSPDGQRVYVANTDANTVSVISTVTNAVTATITIPVADPNTGSVLNVAVTPDGQSVYVVGAQDSAVWVINTATNTVNPQSITVGAAPGFLAISPDGSVVYVVNALGGTISAISTATNTVIKTVTTADLRAGIAVSSTRLYVASITGDSVTSYLIASL